MPTHKLIFTAASTLALCACSASSDSASENSEAASKTIITAPSTAEKVEITLIDVLDGVTSSYCIDIAGGNKNIDITKGLQAHTCYSYRGELGTDQIFSTSSLQENVLYMPDFDVCASLASLEAGALIGLATCDGSSLQKISISESGQISPLDAPSMCFTAATSSRYGKSKTHQIKTLSLEACSTEMAPYQAWRTRATAD